MLNCQKHLFSLDEGVSYLNCAYMSPQLKSVEEAGIKGLKRKNSPNNITPQDFFTDANTLRALFAKLVNAESPQRVALIPSVSYGMAIVAKNLKLQKGQNIVIVEGQFPSNVYAWRTLAAQQNAVINTVTAPNTRTSRGSLWNESLLNAINSQTALVALPNVHWADGTRFDLKAISQKAKAVGALLVIDGTQSVGAYPFDVQDIKPDALVCSAYKWLLTPYTQGFAYLGEYFDDKLPLEETWLSRMGSEDFAQLVNYTDAQLPQALKYDAGGRSNLINVPMSIAALTQLQTWQTADIQAYCKQLTQPLLEVLKTLGWWIEDAQWRGEHLFGIRPPQNVTMAQIKPFLEKYKLTVSMRGDAMRLSPHLYNDENDINNLIKALKMV